MAATRSNRLASVFAASVLVVLLGASSALFGVCGPFTDVAADAFCPFVLEIFTLGITTGTSPTTYDPTSSVSRLQMAAFLSRTVDGVLKRGSRRAAMARFWNTQNAQLLGLTTVGTNPALLQTDGQDVWVANSTSGTVTHVRGTDGKLLETWTGSVFAFGVLTAMGRVFVTGETTPGALYRIDPTQSPGSVTTLASNLGDFPHGIAFDGLHIWTANGTGSVSIVTPGPTIPWTVTTVSVASTDATGILFDGAHIWVTNINGNTLLKLDSAGNTLQTVTVGSGPAQPVFDGANIWVPNSISISVSVVRASTGAVLQTLTGNGLNFPEGSAFDGERILITNYLGQNLSLWKAADFTPLGFFSAGGGAPFGACSDGVNFWITLGGTGQLARF